jgi:hypothetical protein
MISQDLFTDKFKKLITLCSFPQNMANQSNIEIYFDALKFTDERILLSAFKKICSSPPNKLTLAAILHYVGELKPKTECSDWDGTECNIEGCNRGLISEQIGVYSVLFRCLKCDSSKLRWINDHTTENIMNEQQKHKPVERVKEPSKMENLTRGIG